MKFHVSCRIFLGLFFLLQLSEAGEKNPEKLALFMQRNVEHLIEKILSQVQEFYHQIKSSSKCIPDYVPDNVMVTLKRSIDCVSENEKNYALGRIKGKAHIKNFLNCFSQAKREVNETMMAIDPEEDYCPENITEKTYQINVTTTFVKTFQISIANGLEVMHKEIDFSKDDCVNKNSERIENERDSGNHSTPDISNVNSDDIDNTRSSTDHQEDEPNRTEGILYHDDMDGSDDDHQIKDVDSTAFHSDDDDSVIDYQNDTNHDRHDDSSIDNEMLSSELHPTVSTIDHVYNPSTHDGKHSSEHHPKHDKSDDPFDSDDIHRSTEVTNIMHSYSTYEHNDEPISITEIYSTEITEGPNDTYNDYDTHNTNRNVEEERDTENSEDYDGDVDLENIRDYEQNTDEDDNENKSSPEEDSLDEYSFDYDGPEENQENPLNHYENKDYNSDDYTPNEDVKDENAPEPKNTTQNSAEIVYRNSDTEHAQQKAILSNTNRKNLASDVYSQFKKLREDDDYYDIKNGGKAGFGRNYDEFDEGNHGRNENRKRRTKNQPKKFKKYVDGGSFIKNSQIRSARKSLK